MNSIKHYLPLYFDESSPLTTLKGTSAHETIFLAAPGKGLTYVIRFFKSDCLWSS